MEDVLGRSQDGVGWCNGGGLLGGCRTLGELVRIISVCISNYHWYII